MCGSKFLIVLVCLAFIAWGGLACVRAISGSDEGDDDPGIFPLLEMLPVLGTGIFMLAFLIMPDSMLSALGVFVPLLDAAARFFKKYPWMIAPAIILLLGVLIAGGFVWIEARINRWVRRQGYTLLGWRFVWFWNNPWGSLQSRYQHTYLAAVRTEDGTERAVYLRFGSRWGLQPSRTEYIWKDEVGRDPVEEILQEKRRKRDEMKVGKDPNELIKSRW